jgi:hypothetical protein
LPDFLFFKALGIRAIQRKDISVPIDGMRTASPYL